MTEIGIAVQESVGHELPWHERGPPFGCADRPQREIHQDEFELQLLQREHESVRDEQNEYDVGYRAVIGRLPIAVLIQLEVLL
jgi:hypothetical protein